MGTKNWRMVVMRMKCPDCGAEILRKEQAKVEGNFYACANCGTIVYRA